MRRLAVVLMTALFFNTISPMAAIVSDNDGSAFVTKAEFESMKKTFSEEITNYQNSITSKIDGAIASYLAGIKTSEQKDEKSLINSSNKSFVRNWRASKDLKVGDFVQGCLWIGFNATAGTYKTGVSYQVTDTIRWDVQSGTNNICSEIVDYGSTKDYLLKYKKSSYDSTKYNVEDVIESVPYAALNINKLSIDYSQCTNDGTFNLTGFESSFTNVTDGKTQTTTGVVKLNYPDSDADPHYRVGNAARKKPAGGSKQWAFNDSVIATESVVDCVAGGTINLAGFSGFLVDEDNLLGNTSTNVTAQRGWRYGLHQNDSISGSGQMAESLYNIYYIKSYHHKLLTTITNDNVIDDTVSRLVSKNTFLYSGLPLFKSSVTGSVKIKLQVTTEKFNSNVEVSSPSCLFSMSDAQYTNAVPLGGWQGTDDIDLVIKDSKGKEVKNNKLGVDTYEVTFNTKKNKIYWIKAYPDSSEVSFKFQTAGILNKSEE